MATPVRINEDNYMKLQQEADRDRRSVTAQLNVILDDRYARNTTGTPPIITPAPKKTETADLFNDGKQVPVERKDGLIGKKLPDIPAPVPEDNLADGEFACCQNEYKPCKHWVWDTVSGAGYLNSLSGRFREVDG